MRLGKRTILTLAVPLGVLAAVPLSRAQLTGRPSRARPGPPPLERLLTCPEVAERLCLTAGQDEALHLLTPLLKGTIQNLDSRGISGALTGPITRGDVGTVRHHLAVLRKALPTAMPLYRELGKTVLQVAASRGTIDKKKLSSLRRLLGTTKTTKLRVY